MAYSDYGGYAYRNGVRVIDRSDAVITDTAESVPGVYPGFAFVAQGMSPDDASREMHENPHGHAVLGEGPLYVALYKQSDIYVWLDGKRLRIDDHVADAPESCWSECNGVRHFGPTTNLSEEADSRRDVAFVLPDGSRLDVVWMVEDNYYQYAHSSSPTERSGPDGRVMESALASTKVTTGIPVLPEMRRCCRSGKTPLVD